MAKKGSKARARQADPGQGPVARETPAGAEQAPVTLPPPAERVAEASDPHAEAAPALNPEADPPAVEKAKASKRRQAAARPKERKPSALDAAVRVLAEEGRAMSCPELIEAMAVKGYWSSPKGKTPAATLYAAIAREIQTKAAAARFTRSGPGKFARATCA
jgi:hypothetical protein